MEESLRQQLNLRLLNRVAGELGTVGVSTGPGKDRYHLKRSYRWHDPRAVELVDLGDDLTSALRSLDRWHRTVKEIRNVRSA